MGMTMFSIPHEIADKVLIQLLAQYYERHQIKILALRNSPNFLTVNDEKTLATLKSDLHYIERVLNILGGKLPKETILSAPIDDAA